MNYNKNKVLFTNSILGQSHIGIPKLTTISKHINQVYYTNL